MPEATKKRPRWPLILVLIGVAAVAIGVAALIKRDLDATARGLLNRSPAARPSTAAPTPPGLPDDSKIDLREQAVLAARNMDKPIADRIVERLIAKGTLTIKPATRDAPAQYLMS